MSLLDAYPKKTVTWRARGEPNQYNEYTYSETSIDVVWFDSQRVIHQNGHEYMVCDAYCLADAAIQKGDQITKDGVSWPVQSVEFTEGFGDMKLRVVNLSKNEVG